MVDLKRRFFLFGAAATLTLPPARTFHFVKQPLILRADVRIFGFADNDASDTMNRYTAEAVRQLARRMDEQIIDAITGRWAVISPADYERITGDKPLLES